MLKTSKVGEVLEITSSKRSKLLDFLPSENCFDLESISKFKEKVTIRFKLMEIIQKPHVFKQLIGDKYSRLKFIHGVAAQFYDRWSHLVKVPEADRTQDYHS